MVMVWAIDGFHAPIDFFGFQRMDDKVKDGLVMCQLELGDT
jgi:hypothetical protein